MSFGLDPCEWLQFSVESYADYLEDRLSLRKAVACCVFVNHLPEHLVAKYGSSDPGKLHGFASVEAYRGYLLTAEPALTVIRDLCDYAKHGPTLGRKSVTVTKTEQSAALELDAWAGMTGFYNHRRVKKLIVTHKDGSEGWLENYLRKTLEFWKGEFSAMAL